MGRIIAEFWSRTIGSFLMRFARTEDSSTTFNIYDFRWDDWRALPGFRGEKAAEPWAMTVKRLRRMARATIARRAILRAIPISVRQNVEAEPRRSAFPGRAWERGKNARTGWKTCPTASAAGPRGPGCRTRRSGPKSRTGSPRPARSCSARRNRIGPAGRCSRPCRTLHGRRPSGRRL